LVSTFITSTTAECWPTRTENSLAYHIPASSDDYQKNSFFYRTVRD